MVNDEEHMPSAGYPEAGNMSFSPVLFTNGQLAKCGHYYQFVWPRRKFQKPLDYFIYLFN